MNKQEVLLYADKAFACISGHEHEAELSELVTEQILEMLVETQAPTNCATD
tara:strand:- start:254 stop:406 length:153 start_codon:yes stop_codon:yes gene_type:complete